MAEFRRYATTVRQGVSTVTRQTHLLAVDAVLAISLRDRPERREALLRQFEPLGLPIEFVLVERDLEDPERGCYHSHQRCARIAVERGLGRVLVLEDDATLGPVDAAHIACINRFLRLRAPEIFYLGGILGRMWRIPFPGVVRCRLSAGHAYVLSAGGCRRLLSLPFHGEPVDSILAREFKAYAAYPLLSEQQPECCVASDLAQHRHRRLAGNAEVKDAAFWSRNRQRQRESVRRNWGRTLLMRWL